MMGGMGNQMFQYAAAKATAMRLGTQLMFDLAWYDKTASLHGRYFSLGCFELEDHKAKACDVMRLFPWISVIDCLKGDSSFLLRRKMAAVAEKVFFFLLCLPNVGETKKNKKGKKALDTKTNVCYLIVAARKRLDGSENDG